MRRRRTKFAPTYEQILNDRIAVLEAEVPRLRHALAKAAGVSGVEPAYDLRTAAELLLTTPVRLKNYLADKTRRDAFPKRYVLVGHERRRHRLLYASEIERLRQMRWRWAR